MYERQILSQMIEHIDRHSILKEISGYRKGHSTTTVLLHYRDDIVQVMKRGQTHCGYISRFLKGIRHG